MNLTKDRLALFASGGAVLALFTGCLASRGDDSPSEDVGAVTTPTATPGSPKPGPTSDALSYTVTSVKGKKSSSRNCVVARVKVTNGGTTSVGFGEYTRFPSPFDLMDAQGHKIRSIKRTLTINWGVLPGQGDTGSVSLCAAGIASGSRVVLLQGKKKWTVGIPKPKPKPKPKPRVEPRRAPSKSGGGNGGGAYPGYNGPRCYAPGGKTWHPC
ncbi:hypothetical protein [Actinomadura napierensis]|uniref:hypothetical protein n=1 Tax=Actinomadura napierensis TaxID=267854 RepID=UPI0031D94131